MLGCESAATARASDSKRWRSVGIGRDVRGHHLDRDVAIQTRITRAIHLSHAARRDGGDDLVLGKPKAGGK